MSGKEGKPLSARSWRDDGEKIALDELPKKAEEVDTYIQKTFGKYQKLSDAETAFTNTLRQQMKSSPSGALNNHKNIEKAPAAKKRKRDDPTEESDDEGVVDGPRVPPNEEVLEIVRSLRDLIAEAVEFLRVLEMWIRMRIPKIEDGNNFGVEIQEDIFSQIQSSRTTLHRSMGSIHSTYLWSRAQAAGKISRFPNAEDFIQYIVQIDVYELFSLRISALELRDVYESTHDLVKKNIEKLKSPRSHDQATNMY